jgi:hypothetical protein
MEDRPWSEWRDGKPMSARGLAMLLDGFGIKPSQFRTAAGIIRGYRSRDFEEAFARYLPEQPVQTVQPVNEADTTCSDHASPNPVVTGNERGANELPRSSVPGVPPVPGTLGEQLEATRLVHTVGKTASLNGTQDGRDA